MSCTLNKLTTYNVGRVIHDNSTGSTTAQLVNPPASCPDQVFVSKKAIVKVVEGANPELIFDVSQAKPVIIVPRKEYVEQVGSSGFGFGSFLLLAALAMGLIYLVLRLRRNNEDGELAYATTSTGPTPAPRGGGFAASPRLTTNPAPTTPAQVTGAPAQNSNGGGGTTIINNGGGGNSNDGLLTGMVLGSMLSGGGRSERVVERETIIERDRPSANFSSDTTNDDSDNSSSSSNDDSFSSDSSDDSSFSSDSSSDDSSFSSDSGGSDFSSDSGGGDFSSDS